MRQTQTQLKETEEVLRRQAQREETLKEMNRSLYSFNNNTFDKPENVTSLPLIQSHNEFTPGKEAQ